MPPISAASSLSILLVTCALGASCVAARPRPAAPVTGVEAVLLSKDMFACGDEAVLVIEPAAVAALVAGVRDNETVAHACGHHWLISFIGTDGNITHAGHDLECEKYIRDDRGVHRLLEGYFRRAERGLEQFLLDITIDASMTLEQASHALAAEGRVFSPSGEAPRLPSVTLQASATRAIPQARAQWNAASDANERAATDLVMSAVAVVLRAHPAATAGEPVVKMSSFGGNEIVDDVECRIELPFGTDPASLPSLPPGTFVGEVEVPTRVVVQLVTPTRLDAAARAALRERHPFLLDVARHDEGCRPAR